MQLQFQAAEEQGVMDKLQALSILPDWLNSLHHSIEEFATIAKSLQPVASSGNCRHSLTISVITDRASNSGMIQIPV